MFRTLTTSALVFSVTLLSGCSIYAGESGVSVSLGQEADTPFEWTGEVADGQWLEIKGIGGAVNAIPASGDTISVNAVRRGLRSDPNEVDIVVVEHPEGVTICAVYPSSGNRPNECTPGDGGQRVRRNDVKVTFDVEMPRGVRFAGRMVNGRVYADGLEADVLARTVNGRIDLSTAGHASARSVNGSIDAAMGANALPGDTTFETVNGSITLDLAQSLGAQLDVRTVNGRIRTDLPIETTRSSRRRLQGTLGSGGPALTIKTVNGSVTLE